ncbi:SGNH hydrolase domain-containing protein [Planotetraspora phitsanulokensis]|uniref:Acyltransferase n=1 Tax=Planotetraspora phitsanulokensis TaxID=575192 RepID=A0A8J3UDD3_9ACTN|nr:acyltransferase family protein [Planotetraspora phitsanulokensis]GII40364.1 acyltransferase [Planotetraspora phitsanulokensis]
MAAQEGRLILEESPAPATSAEQEESSSAEGRGSSSRFRGDIEGLRAVAVGLVLLYHAGLPFLPGGFVGVDVFFVISGFLITTQLLSEMGRTGTISLVRFYARRAKRLLPAAGIVLLVSAVLTRLFIPATRWSEIGGDIAGAALYVVNWRFADRSVDYLAEDSQPSPVQHFWSLAVEEQFYLVWPLLILAAIVVARMLRGRTRPTLWVGLALVVIPSFAWSLSETANIPARAFFETTTRMWELGIGAAVALAAGAFTRLPRGPAIGLGWAGLAAIAAAGLLITGETAWPGYAAALPTLGAAAVIAAGFSVTRGGPSSLLALRPFRWIGGLSYSLYLWHWPLLVAATAYLGELSTAKGLIVAAASVVPAWLTARLVENPLRHSAAISRSSRLALSMGANFTLLGVAAGLVLLLGVTTTQMPAGAVAQGAAALGDKPRDSPAGAVVDRVDWMTPTPTEATEDVPDAYANGCQQVTTKSEVVTCQYGDKSGPTTVAVVGDSKMAQWMPALQSLADQNGWNMITYFKSACGYSLATTQYDGTPYQSCREWTDEVRRRLTSDPPDFVITSQGEGKALDEGGGPTQAAMVEGLRGAWSELTSLRTRVVVVADNAPPGLNVYECVAKNPEKLSACAFDRKRSAASAAPTQRLAAKGRPRVAFVDLSDAICPAERCAPVIGNVLVYRQGSHITATYVESLTPRLATALTKAKLPTAYQPGTS